MAVPSRSTRTEIDAHLVGLLYSGTFSTILIHVICAIILMVVLRHHIPAPDLIVWGGAFATVMGLRALLYALYARAEPGPDQIEPWIHYVKATSFFTGVIWGGAAWVFMPMLSVEHQLFTSMIIIIIAAGAASKLYPMIRIYSFFVAPMLILVVARFVVIGTELHFAMAAAAFVLLAFLTYFAVRHRDDLLHTLKLQTENEALLQQLSQENREVRGEQTEQQKMETLLRQKTAVLNAVSKVQSLFIADREPADIFNETLETIISLTSSEFGFIGEVLLDETDQRYLKIFAISDVPWGGEASNMFKNVNTVGQDFHNNETLFGSVLKSGEPVITNAPMSDPRSGGVPKGHPMLKSFLGVPLYVGEDMIGMVGLANREDGYDIELLTALDPVISAIARMAEALQSRRARTETQHQLAEAKEQAEKASLAKTEFLSSMSHELRTPMNAVLGFAQLLQLNPQVPLHPKQADSVEQILKAGNHLLELINEILDLSRIEAGRVSLSLEDIDPHEVIEDCISYISPMATRRGLTLDAQVPAQDHITLHTDRTRFRQVLLNLLSNAVKYNNDGGTVSLSIHQNTPGKMRFCVSDTGSGIPQERHEELFQPFSRLGAESTDIEGTGIGLTISRRLTELMGGELDFESVVGRGSNFWIDLPGEPKQVAAVDAQLDEQALPQMPGGGHMVLYVEDNPDNLSLMEEVISMVDNVELISAHTGELGLEMAEIHHPDVILMDINLPGITGIEALHRLRKNPDTQDIPVIALSADAMSEDIQRGLDEGFDAYLTKPINLGQVIDHISMAVEGKLVSKEEN